MMTMNKKKKKSKRKFLQPNKYNEMAHLDLEKMKQ